MNCTICGKEIVSTAAMHCENCMTNYCTCCANSVSLCLCNHELKYYN